MKMCDDDEDVCMCGDNDDDEDVCVAIMMMMKMCVCVCGENDDGVSDSDDGGVLKCLANKVDIVFFLFFFCFTNFPFIPPSLPQEVGFIMVKSGKDKIAEVADRLRKGEEEI